MSINPSIEGAPSYTFADPTILWVKDVRMGNFAADLKSAAWEDM